MSKAPNFRTIKSSLPPNVLLVAVTKNQSSDVILELYEQGQRDFGENKVQELTRKSQELPKDIRWHMIGHLQTNKVKYIASFVHLIHSVHSANLLEEINKRAFQNNRIIDCLLEVHIAQEQTKSGFSEDDLMFFLNNLSINTYNNIRICGLMGMATYTANFELVENEFDKLNKIFLYCKENFFTEYQYFKHLSMGMSNDYLHAINNGATIIRLGSLLYEE